MTTNVRSLWVLNSLYPRQLRGDGRGHPLRGEAEVGKNHLRGVVGGEAGDVAAGVRARAAEVKAGQVRAIGAGAGKRAVIADLVVGKRADEEIAFAHVGKLALGVERRARKRIKRRVGEIGRVRLPKLAHGAGVLLAQAVPVRGIAVDAIGQL